MGSPISLFIIKRLKPDIGVVRFHSIIFFLSETNQLQSIENKYEGKKISNGTLLTMYVLYVKVNFIHVFF